MSRLLLWYPLNKELKKVVTVWLIRSSSLTMFWLIFKAVILFLLFFSSLEAWKIAAFSSSANWLWRLLITNPIESSKKIVLKSCLILATSAQFLSTDAIFKEDNKNLTVSLRTDLLCLEKLMQNCLMDGFASKSHQSAMSGKLSLDFIKLFQKLLKASKNPKFLTF